MTKEQIEKHLNRTDRHFEFKDRVTYIERQDITVQSGAIFNNGPAPEGNGTMGKVVKESSIDNQMSAEENNEVCELSLLERIQKATYAVIHSQLMLHDYYYIALYKIIEEQNVIGVFGFADLPKLIADADSTFKCPNPDNYRKEIIKGKYPDWKLVDRGYDVLRDYLNIGKLFVTVFNEKSPKQTQK